MYTRKYHPILFILIIILLLNFYEIISSDIISKPLLSLSSKWASLRTSASKTNYTSNLLRVDPRLILQTMNKFGSGLILSSDYENDLRVLEKVCRYIGKINLTQMHIFNNRDLVNRELEILDFVVLHNETSTSSPALKISKVLIRWDSYLSPCIDIHLEDVEIFVEFSNLLLTRNNWNDLADVGFPPTTSATQQQASSSDADETISDTFIRIGSLNLLGSVKLRVWSKPLNQAISPDFVFKFESLKELMDKIQSLSSNNISLSSSSSTKERKGCTTTKVYEVITNYTNTKIRQIAKSTIFDLAKTRLDPKTHKSTTAQQAKSLFHGATNVIRNYAQKSLDYTDENFQMNAETKLKKWGFDSDEAQTLIEASKAAASTAISSWTSQYKSTTASTTSSNSNLPLLTITDSSYSIYDNDEDGMLMEDDQFHWLKRGYHSATEAAMNVFVNKMLEIKEIGIDDNANMVQPDEIFFPPF